MTPGEPLIRWDWLASHLGDIGQRLGEHVVLASIAIVLGFVLAFALSLRAYEGANRTLTSSPIYTYTITLTGGTVAAPSVFSSVTSSSVCCWTPTLRCATSSRVCAPRKSM